MALVFTIPIATKSGSYYAPVESGTYYLRVSPFSSNTYTGTHLGSGVWSFGTVADGNYQLWDASAQVASFGEFWVGDNNPTFTGLTMSGNIVMGSNKLTGLAAGSSNGDSVTYEQVIRTADNQTGIAGNKSCTGIWQFDDLAFPKIDLNGSGEVPTPSSSQEFTPKKYVDDLFGGVVTPILSTYEIQLIPTRTADDYSKTTLEACNTLLAAKSNITTYRGVINIHPLAATNNSLTVDASATAWCSNGVDIFSPNKARITRGGNNSSLTSDSRITNIHIYENTAVSARAYTNFTFKDCDFTLLGSTDIAFTSCKFLGTNRIYTDGGTVTLTNCTGLATIGTNGTFILSGTYPCGSLLDGLDINDLGIPA